MSRWWRAYDDAVDDAKLCLLSDRAHRAWFNLCCLTSKNGGTLPETGVLAFKLRMKTARVIAVLAELKTAGLVDEDERGQRPHNWDHRQFVSDGSAERVKRHRAKREAAGLEAQWFPSKKLRIEVYTRDNFQCVYCGSEENLSIDHRTPQLRGGTHDLENLQTACRSCNGAKRDMTHEEYVARNESVTLLKRPQRTEQTTEQKDIAANAASTGNGKYAFESGAIRLTAKDFTKWEQAFKHLDLAAELIALAPWAATQASWFNAVAGALAKKNREMKLRTETAKTGGQLSRAPSPTDGFI